MKPIHRWLIAAGVLVFVVVGLCAGLGAALQDAAGKTPDTTSHPIIGLTAPTPVRTMAPADVTLTTTDIKLTVKITSKACFGSAGCNVEFTTQAATSATPSVACSVTYALHGLDDQQINTLTINPDGTYDHDETEFGSTARSSAKVTASVTAVDCNG